MDPERWKKISSIYRQAIALEGEARNQYLTEACNDDDDLRKEVDALLAVPDEEAVGIDKIVDSAAIDYAERLGTNERIGPYRLSTVIGRGGMGQVFLAERVDQEFDRKVAIKTISWLNATPELIERFRQERQILANLDHPNIARLLDGGSTENNVPYFVMEYVAGQNIIEFCQERKLSHKRKLELFLEICDAVQYAHRNLVIHRDIKPSNILITADGTPKLLDFGIAKLMDSNAAVTRADMRFLTQQYASPEQVRGEEASTSTDVYGLGLLLYELLTDQFPYPIEGSTSIEIERLIRETEPVAPSIAVLNSEKRVQVPNVDLDNIVLMALRKEADRRYQTVRDLAQDVRNFLAQKPVLARTPTYRYRAGKFIARNILGVASVTAALLAAITMTAFYTVQLAAERDIAQQERRIAETTTDFMVDLFEDNSPAQALGQELSARDVLDRGAEKLTNELQESPPVRARLLLTLGRVYERLGVYEPAREYLEQSIELYRNDVPDSEQVTIENLEELAWIYYRSEDWELASNAANEALLRREARVGPDDPSLVKVLNHLGTIAYWRDDFAGALAYYHRALSLLTGGDEESAALRATTLNHLGITYDILDRNAEAESSYLESLQIRIGLYGEMHPDTGTAVANLGAYYANAEDLEKATSFAERALAIDREIRGNEHADVAYDLGLLASIERQRENYPASIEYAQEALGIWGRTVGETHSRYISTLDGIASTYIDSDNFEAAFEYAIQARDIALVEAGVDHTMTADTLYTMGRALRGLDRFDDARATLIESAGIRLARLGAESRAYWDVQQLLALVEFQSGNLNSATEYIAGVLAYVDAYMPDDAERLVIVLDRYIAILEEAGDNPSILDALKSRRAGLP